MLPWNLYIIITLILCSYLLQTKLRKELINRFNNSINYSLTLKIVANCNDRMTLSHVNHVQEYFSEEIKHVRSILLNCVIKS